MYEAVLAPTIAWDIWLAGRPGMSAIATRQQARFASLVAFARRRSRLLRQTYAGVAETIRAPGDVPPVTKPELMARFDDWVTDDAVTLGAVQRFMDDPGRIGQDFLGRYAVWRGSGTSGRPGVFLHDRDSMVIQDLLFCCRAAPGLMSAADAWRFAAGGGRTACIAALDGHFAGVAAWRRLGRSYAGPFAGIRLLSVLMPVDALVEKLNAIAPVALVAYPSVLELLAHEQRAGRLRLAPVLIMTGGECLDPGERETVESAFGCRVREIYGCSEFEYLAFDCEQGWLHLNADWAMLEPVDATGCAVPAGTVSHSCLLTNLANRVQPLIRYDLGDRILVRPDPCPCGCPLPAIRVEGRDTEILTFAAAGGRRVEVMPMALVDLLEEIPGIGRFQVVQTGPSALQIGFEASLGMSADSVWQAIERSLQGFIASQGLGHVRLERAATPPLPDPRSGKFRQICARPGPLPRPRRPSLQT